MIEKEVGRFNNDNFLTEGKLSSVCFPHSRVPHLWWNCKTPAHDSVPKNGRCHHRMCDVIRAFNFQPVLRLIPRNHKVAALQKLRKGIPLFRKARPRKQTRAQRSRSFLWTWMSITTRKKSTDPSRWRISGRKSCCRSQRIPTHGSTKLINRWAKVCWKRVVRRWTWDIPGGLSLTFHEPYCADTNFNPTIEPIRRKIKNTLQKSEGSLKRAIPTIAVPTAPMPVQTA